MEPIVTRLHQNIVVFKNEAPNKIYKFDIIAKAAEYAFLGVNESKKKDPRKNFCQVGATPTKLAQAEYKRIFSWESWPC